MGDTMSLRRDYYQETLELIEPDLAMVDPGTYYASAAVSLKRIADVLERLERKINAQSPANDASGIDTQGSGESR